MCSGNGGGPAQSHGVARAARHDDMSWVLLDAIGGGAGSSERVVPGSCV